MTLIEEFSEFLIPDEIIYKDEAAQKVDEIVDSVLGNRMRAPIARSISKQISDICIVNMKLDGGRRGIPPLIFSLTNQVIPVGIATQDNDVKSLAVLVASS